MAGYPRPALPATPSASAALGNKGLNPEMGPISSLGLSVDFAGLRFRQRFGHRFIYGLRLRSNLRHDLRVCMIHGLSVGVDAKTHTHTPTSQELIPPNVSPNLAHITCAIVHAKGRANVYG